MRIRESNEWKTAFKTPYGHFEYQMMPFRLSNAPASFQGYIIKILAKKLNVFVIVYLDDILIYTKDENQGHVEAVQLVLNFLKEWHFCQFEKMLLSSGWGLLSRVCRINLESVNGG